MIGDLEIYLTRGSSRLVIGINPLGEVKAFINSEHEPSFFAAYAIAQHSECRVDARGGLALWIGRAAFDLRSDDEAAAVCGLLGLEAVQLAEVAA